MLLQSTEGARAPKFISPDGIEPYGKGKYFWVDAISFESVEDLAAALELRAPLWSTFVVRGALKRRAITEYQLVRRLCHDNWTPLQAK